MKPVEFPEQNTVLGKPPTMTAEQCENLPVFVGEDNNHYPQIVSCWELSDDDIMDIVQTKRIYLGVCGFSTPQFGYQLKT